MTVLHNFKEYVTNFNIYNLYERHDVDQLKAYFMENAYIFAVPSQIQTPNHKNRASYWKWLPLFTFAKT